MACKTPRRKLAAEGCTEEMQLTVVLTTSLTMLALSICMSGGICLQKNRMPIDGTGILQIIWLANRLRLLKDIMNKVDDPREDMLRAAGMLDVDLLQELNEQEY